MYMLSTKQDCQALYDRAHKAGMSAMGYCQPTPMIVQQHRNMLDDSSPVVKSYYVGGGVCGFAWVSLRPGTGAFARWARVQGYAKTDSYAGGLMFWVKEGGQSYERKMSYGAAFAEVLCAAGLKASVKGRLD